jgi:hypothetical protein
MNAVTPASYRPLVPRSPSIVQNVRGTTYDMETPCRSRRCGSTNTSYPIPGATLSLSPLSVPLPGLPFSQYTGLGIGRKELHRDNRAYEGRCIDEEVACGLSKKSDASPSQLYRARGTPPRGELHLRESVNQASLSVPPLLRPS